MSHKGQFSFHGSEKRTAERTLHYLPRYLCPLSAIFYTKKDIAEDALEYNGAENKFNLRYEKV